MRNDNVDPLSLLRSTHSATCDTSTSLPPPLMAVQSVLSPVVARAPSPRMPEVPAASAHQRSIRTCPPASRRRSSRPHYHSLPRPIFSRRSALRRGQSFASAERERTVAAITNWDECGRRRSEESERHRGKRIARCTAFFIKNGTHRVRAKEHRASEHYRHRSERQRDSRRRRRHNHGTAAGRR